MGWFSDWLSRLAGTLERPSSKIRISQKQIEWLPDGTITIKGLRLGTWITTVKNTNSMEPMIDEGMICFLEPITNMADLIVGDIIVYFGIIHRIVKIGEDKLGWYCKCRGDNNNADDPYIIRPENITHVFRGVLT